MEGPFIWRYGRRCKKKVEIEITPTPTDYIEPEPIPTEYIEPTPTPTEYIEPTPTPTEYVDPIYEEVVEPTPTPTPTVSNKIYVDELPPRLPIAGLKTFQRNVRNSRRRSI